MATPPTYDKSLLQITWRGLNFPITDLQTAFTQSHVSHKFPDRDGAYVESTGRDEIRVTCKALFYNHISRGPLEFWDYGTLFPSQFNRFLDACKDRTVGRLVHPFLGGFDAKVQSFSATLDATNRSGASVDVTWVDTIKPSLEEQVTDASNAAANAQAFDDEMNTIRQQKIIVVPSTTPTDFVGEIGKIKAFIDSTTLQVQKALAAIDRVTYHVNNVMFSLQRANSVTLSPAIQKAKALRASLIELRQQLNSKVAAVRIYIVPKDTTLGELVQRLGNNQVDLIKLNPSVVKQPVIEARTPIRYFAGI